MGRIDWVAMTAKARDLLAGLRVEIDVGVPVKMLSIAERQSIEIVRALSIDARVLVMDEPTSAISGREVDRLFEIVGRLKSQGAAILFISHFLDEILGLGDEVTVLRSGRRITTCATADLTPEAIVRHMIGTEPGAFFLKQTAEIGRPVMTVRGLSGAGFVEDVGFEVRAGEILGFFGLVGAGRSEVAEMLFGIARPDRGEIGMDGRAVRPRSPREAIRLGISFLPEDRHQQGLVLQFPIRANETLPILRQLSGILGLVDRAAEAKVARDFADRIRVVATGIEQLTSTLSGGNQQKVAGEMADSRPAAPHPGPADTRSAVCDPRKSRRSPFGRRTRSGRAETPQIPRTRFAPASRGARVPPLRAGASLSKPRSARAGGSVRRHTVRRRLVALRRSRARAPQRRRAHLRKCRPLADRSATAGLPQH